MKLLLAQEISTLFNKSVGDENKLQKIGYAAEGLSRAIAGLQNAGIDVSFKPRWSEIDSYLRGVDLLENSFIGILRIHHSEYLVSLETKDSSSDYYVLQLSRNPLHQGNGDEIWAFNLGNDEDAYVKFQKRVIAIARHNKLLFDHDVAGVFERPEKEAPLLNKMGLKR